MSKKKFTVEVDDTYDEPNFFIHDSKGRQIGDNFTDEMDAVDTCEKLNNGGILPEDV